MNAVWQEFLRGCGASIADGLVTDFGDAPAELAAAREEAVIAPLAHCALIEVSGADAAAFLHNQLTSDVKHLASDAAQHSAWCSAKGRMLASFLVFRGASRYRLQVSADLLPTILRRLQMFVLRSAVKISDQSGAHELIGLAGPDAVMVLQSAGLPIPGTPLSTADFGDGVVVRLESSRFEIVVSEAAVTAVWSALQATARPIGTAAWQWLDIQAGVPLITSRTTEEFVPQMANFEQLGAVSFHKGCYPGQEIVARTQYLGKVKRHLYRLHSASPMATGDAIYSPANPEHPCGMIANAAPAPGGGYDALAVAQESLVNTGGLQLGTPGGPQVDLLSSVG